MSRRRFVLLDRDGTIIIEKHYLSEPDAVELIDGAAAGLRRLAEQGLGLVIVTNQSGIARGYFDQDRLERIHGRLAELLRAEDVRLDGIYVCPHHPDAGCECRKPRPGLVLRAAREHGFDPARSFVVGDAPSDMDLARGVGATGVLVRTGYGVETEVQGPERADFVEDDLGAAARRILDLAGAPDA